jgi:hypothetical protein
MMAHEGKKNHNMSESGGGKGGERKEGKMLLTECEDNVEDFFAGQFGRDGGIGGGGGIRGLGELLGDDWDGHRGERDDDDEQIEARPEERFGESSREEGHGSGRV